VSWDKLLIQEKKKTAMFGVMGQVTVTGMKNADMFDVMGQVTDIGIENAEMFGVMRQVTTDIGMENVENLEAKVMDSFLIYC
jgi:hypothetical protein